MEILKDITWLGHASFFFTDETSGQQIYYVDPFELRQPNLPKGDLIFITHAHPDHLSSKDIAAIITNNTTIIAPQNCLDKLEYANAQTQRVEPHKSYTVRNFSFQTIPAYNTKSERLMFHPKDNNWVGYIFSLNGKKIYHAGDTDFIPEMKSLAKLHLDVAMLPIGGTYTMNVVEAIDAANAIAAKITIPMHYKRLVGDTYREVEEQFKEGVTASRVEILSELA